MQNRYGIFSLKSFKQNNNFILCVSQVDDNKKLGEWAGLCKIDKEGKARKVVGCSCVVVKDYGKESQALDVLNDYFRSKK
uniref:40S ribosomal protein S12 n=1 Tax=Magallana gigas TaxID=29159 RepID=A0A8W8LJB6_MAGGI